MRKLKKRAARALLAIAENAHQPAEARIAAAGTLLSVGEEGASEELAEAIGFPTGGAEDDDEVEVGAKRGATARRV